MYCGGYTSVGVGSPFSIFLLCSIMDMAWCIAILFISLKVFLMGFIGILTLVSRIFIEGMYVDALAPAVITISGSTIHPLFLMSLMRGWYFSIFLAVVSGENLSLQYVNSINCTLKLMFGDVGGFDR